MGNFFFLFGRSLGQRKGGAKAAERMVKKQKGIKRNTSLALGNVQEYLTVSPCAWPPQPEPDHKSNLAFARVQTVSAVRMMGGIERCFY